MKMRSFQKRFTGTLLTLVLPLLCFGFLALSISYHFVSSSARLNTNKRLFIAFGGEAKVSIDSKPDQGTQVTILIPLLTGDE